MTNERRLHLFPLADWQMVRVEQTHRVPGLRRINPFIEIEELRVTKK